MDERPKSFENLNHPFSPFQEEGDPKDWSPVDIPNESDFDSTSKLLQRARTTLFNVLMGERELVEEVMATIQSSHKLPTWLRESLANEKPLVR